MLYAASKSWSTRPSLSRRAPETGGQPQATGGNQEAVSHADRLVPEELRDVERKAESERHSAPSWQDAGSPDCSPQGDGPDSQHQQPRGEQDESRPVPNLGCQVDERRVVLPDRLLADGVETE